VAQLPLALTLAAHARFDTFVVADNAAAAGKVHDVAAGSAEVAWLWGPAASGKTHLLQAACRAAADAGRRAMYIPLGAEHTADPAIVAGLEYLDVLAIDDVGRVARQPEWERALFVLFNEMRDRGAGLLLADRSSAAGAGIGLPDLGTRLAGALSYRLQPLDDAQRASALQLQASARGLELEQAAADYLVRRLERDMATLVRWLDKADRASLAEQRRLTIPFIRTLLSGGE
jgi:DnaA family protein